MADFDPDAYLKKSGGFDPDAYLGGGPKPVQQMPTYTGMDVMGQPVEVEPSMGALRTRQAAEKEVGKGFFSGLGQSALGIPELIPGVGTYAAKGIKELQQVGDPTAQKIGIGTGMAVPLPLGKGKALEEGLGVLRRTWEGIKGGAKVGGIGGLMAPSGREDASRYLDKALSGAAGSILGGAIGAGVSGIPAAYGASKEYLRKLLGRDVADAEARLLQEAIAAGKEVQSKLSAEQKQALATLQQEVDRKAAATEAGEKAGAKVGEALAGPKAKTEEYLGEFGKRVPTMDEIGTFLRQRVNSFVDNIKKQRNSAADRDLTEAMTSAASREKEGITPGILPSVGGAAPKGFKDSEKMLELRGFIDSKLATETDQTLRSQLLQVRNALFGTTDRGAAPSFASSETIRRKIGDAAFGLPEEGYAAIGQNLAKDMYGKLSDAMKAYEPAFAKYLENYKRLSENIDNVGTKLGKALVGVEKDAPAYFAVAARNLPDKAFSSPENVRILVEAMGNNKEPVLAAAERYIANKMAETGSLEGARKFLNKDTTRALMKELGGDFERRITDKYLSQATAMSRRSEGMQATIKQSEDRQAEIAKSLADIEKRTGKVEAGLAQLDAALSGEAKRTAASKLIADLEKEVTPQELARLRAQIEAYAAASEAKTRAISLAAKSAGYGAAGAGATYYGGKYATESFFGKD